MRVGVYIDGFNLYYGGRACCGRGAAGWRWLDVRSLAASQLPAEWNNASVTRLVYCTARVSGIEDPGAPGDQDRYLRALELSGSVDHFEYGNFVARVRHSPLVTTGKKGKPVIVESRWPVMVKDAAHVEVPDARFIVSHLHREEKGSDVNVATHLMRDVFEKRVEAVVIVSNDSDLKLPIAAARDRLPVGIITPSSQRLAGDLAFAADDGAGSHWQGNLAADDFRNHQLPDPVGPVANARGMVTRELPDATLYLRHSPSPCGGWVFFCAPATSGALTPPGAPRSGRALAQRRSTSSANVTSARARRSAPLSSAALTSKKP